MTAERIAEEYGSQVSAICRRMITNRALAEEAAQESWLEIFTEPAVFPERFQNFHLDLYHYPAYRFTLYSG